jgi:hypothetical protein
MDTETLTYVLEAVDNVTPKVDRIVDAQGNLKGSAEVAQRAIDSQSISFLKQMQVATGLHRGLGMLIRSSTQLGLINEETAKTFEGINSAIGLVSGSFQMLKAGEQIIRALTNAELGLAAVESFRSVLKNPAMMAVVGMGVGAAAGVGAMSLMGNGGGGSSTTSVNQTVIFGSNSSSERSMAKAAYEAAGGF